LDVMEYQNRTQTRLIFTGMESLPPAMTTGQDSSFEDQNQTTPIQVAHQTAGSSMTSSSSRGIGLYFQCGVLVVGVVGTAANALVLYGLLASKQHKKHVLVFNQNLLDFASCLFQGVMMAFVLCNIYLDGTLGYWLCMLLVSDCFSWGTSIGSTINLAAISIERYLKVVHHVWAKKNLRNWMTYSTIAFSWIGGIGIALAATFPTTDVVYGVCYYRSFFKSQTAKKVYGIWLLLSLYVIILLIFVYCYGRILTAIRRQARVMAAHSGQGSNTAQNQSHKIQTSIIKTMILVSGLYAITWAPLYVAIILEYIFEYAIHVNSLYTVLSIGYVYVCINPFIYAIKFDPVRRVLLGLIPCTNNMQVPDDGSNT